MFKKIFITLLILTVLVLGGLSYYVSAIDWNNHKAKITSQIENLTGKKIVINGKIDLKFLPTPRLTANDIKIYSNTDQKLSTPLANIKEMNADLSLVPLIHKHFVIDNMSLTDANILIEFLDNGKTNWHSETSADQDFALPNIDMEFNSIVLKNSVVRIVNKTLNFDSVLHKVNADISAQSLVGPFRIDGNFIKDNTPAGFALNVGTLSESFATSLNLVLTHPSSESYARFDGSIFSNNSEIQGNFTIESQKPSTFLNTISGQNLLDSKYNYPLASSVELKVSPEQIDLSSFIVKYGDHLAGSGQVLIPLIQKTDETRKIEIKFEMTDLDLMPLSALLKEILKKFDGLGKIYQPAFDYDMIVDVTATRAHFNDDFIRNFSLSADVVNNIIQIKNLSGLMVGDTDASIKGSVFENDKHLSYSLKVQGLSQDFLKFLNWLDIKPQTYAPSTYRSARAAFEMSGNLNEIKIVPFEFGMDKIETSGVIGIKRDRKNSYFASLQSENINFDNYLTPLVEENKKLSTVEKLKKILGQLKFLNTTDIQANLSLGLGIYNKTPFEKTVLKFRSADGKVLIEQLDINNFATAKINVTGTISNLASNPMFENLKYNIQTSDFKNFVSKCDIASIDWPLFAKANRFELKGIMSGSTDVANIRTVAQIDQTLLKYEGRLSKQSDLLYFRGKFDLKAPDFVDFVNKINLSYNPKNLTASVLNFNADVEGDFSNWSAKNADAFVGTNHFSGSFSYDKTGEKPAITADINTDLFEFDRFIFSPSQKRQAPKKKVPAAFIERPLFDATKIDYSPLKSFDLNGTFNIKNLSYLNDYIENVSFNLDVKNNKISLQNLKANKASSLMDGDFVIDLASEPVIKGALNLNNIPIDHFGGTQYAIEKGVADIKVKYEGSAVSVSDFVKTFDGQFSFDVKEPLIKGINLEKIEEDLKKRQHSEGLEEFLTKNLTSGETSFNFIAAELNFQDGQYDIQTAVITSPVANITFSGDGSLNNWQTNLNFDIYFNRLENETPPISFTLKESLENPVFSLNAADLKNKYDSYWQKIEDETKRKEEEKQKVLDEQMSASQKVVTREIDLLNAEVFPRIKRYQPFAANIKMQNAYESINIQAKDILKNLKEFSALAHRDYTQKDIDDINLQTEVYAPSITDLIDRLDEDHIFDLQLHISDDIERIEAIHNNSLEKSKNYQNTLNSYSIRLMQIGSLVILDQLDAVQTNKNKIEKALENIATTQRKASLTNDNMEDIKDIPLLDKTYQNIHSLRDNAEKNFKELNTALEDLFLYIQDVVYFEQTGEHKIKKTEAPVEQKQETTEELIQEEVIEKPKDTSEEIQSEEPQITSEEVDTQSTLVQTKNEDIEQTSQTESSSTVIEPSKESEPQIPLLIESKDDYASKMPASGVVQIKGTKTIAPETVAPTSLLKPVDGPVLIEGTVKRK